MFPHSTRLGLPDTLGVRFRFPQRLLFLLRPVPGRFGQDEVFLRRFGFQRLKPFFECSQIVPEPDAAHAGDAQLDAGVRVRRPHRFGEAGKPVHARGGDILDAAVFQFGKCPHPEFGPFVLLYPQP